MNIEAKKLRLEIEKYRVDIEINFLNRWVILTGGTFSLLIPLIQSLEKEIKYPHYLVWGGGLILASLIASLIGLFFAKEDQRGYNFITHNLKYFSRGKIRINTDKVLKNFFIIKEIASIISISAYVTGIIFIGFFIKSNLL